MDNDIETLATALYVKTDDMPRDWPDLAPERVPLEYSIGCVTCTVADMVGAVVVGFPGAAQDRLPVGWRPESGVKGTGAVPVHGDVRRWR